MFANQCRLRYDVRSIQVADNMDTPKLIAQDRAKHAAVCWWSQKARFVTLCVSGLTAQLPSRQSASEESLVRNETLR